MLTSVPFDDLTAHLTKEPKMGAFRTTDGENCSSRRAVRVRVAAYGVHHRLRGEGTVGLGAKFGRAG